MKTPAQSRLARVKPFALAAAVTLAVSGLASAQDASVQHSGRPTPHPTEQTIAVTSSTLELMEAQIGAEAVPSEPVELLRTSFRGRFPTDLVIRLNGECALWVDDSAPAEEPPPEEEPTEGEEPPVEEEEAPAVSASITTWLELDGTPISVAENGGASDDGTVVFCNSDQTLALADLMPEQVIERFNASREATGFGWVSENIGRGNHELVVKARLDLTAAAAEDGGEGDDTEENAEPIAAKAMAVFGKRSLIVERERVRHETFTPPEE